MGPYGAIRVHMGPCGPIWAHTGRPGRGGPAGGRSGEWKQKETITYYMITFVNTSHMKRRNNVSINKNSQTFVTWVMF